MSVPVGQQAVHGEDLRSRGTGAARHRRVVVGVDGSPGARAAMIRALALGARHGLEVEAVSSYAVSPFWSGEYPVDVPAPVTLRADTEARTDAFVAEIRRSTTVARIPGAAAVPVHVVVSAHPAARALLERSTEEDLLVVGSRGRGPLRSALLGSVALDCLTHARGSVLVVHPRAAAAATPPLVVVGVDGSPASRTALAAAMTEAGRIGGQVEVVHAYELTDYWVDVCAGEMPTPAEMRDQARRRAEDLVREAVRTAPQPPPVRTVVTEGPADDVLRERSRSAELLVVGRRGTGSFPPPDLGPVALQTVLHAPCPVLVVAPAADAADRPHPAGTNGHRGPSRAALSAARPQGRRWDDRAITRCEEGARDE